MTIQAGPGPYTAKLEGTARNPVGCVLKDGGKTTMTYFVSTGAWGRAANLTDYMNKVANGEIALVPLRLTC